MDFAKDVVYIEAAKSLNVVRWKFVFYDILVKITKLLDTQFCHTAEEIWSYWSMKVKNLFIVIRIAWSSDFPQIKKKFGHYLPFMDRSQAQKALEEARRRLSENRWKRTWLSIQMKSSNIAWGSQVMARFLSFPQLT